MLQAWSPLAGVGTLALAVFLFHTPPPPRVTVLVARPGHAQPPAEWQRSARRSTASHKTGPLTAAQVDRYYEDGFLVLPSFVGQGLLTRLREDVEVQIDKLARRLYRSGKVRTLPNTGKIQHKRRRGPLSPLLPRTRGEGEKQDFSDGLPFPRHPHRADERVVLAFW